MALIVHKYGGTSMGSTERIRNVAKRVAKWARAGHQMVVVPSAMSGETNRLLGLAKELAPGKPGKAYGRELDMLAAHLEIARPGQWRQFLRDSAGRRGRLCERHGGRQGGEHGCGKQRQAQADIAGMAGMGGMGELRK